MSRNRISSYVYQGQPGVEEEAARERQRRRERYLRERYGPEALQEEDVFRRGYERRGYQRYTGTPVAPTEVEPRYTKRPPPPEPQSERLEKYLESLERTASPQYDWIPPQELTQLYNQGSTQLRGYAGSSNVRKYGPDAAPFCGPAGGALPNTYPVFDYRHYRQALSYARNAPVPEGVRRCAYNVAQQEGWVNQSDPFNRFPPKLYRNRYLSQNRNRQVMKQEETYDKIKGTSRRRGSNSRSSSKSQSSNGRRLTSRNKSSNVSRRNSGSRSGSRRSRNSRR